MYQTDPPAFHPRWCDSTAPQPACSTCLGFGKDLESEFGTHKTIFRSPSSSGSYSNSYNILSEITLGDSRGNTHLPSTFKIQKPQNEAAGPWRQRGKKQTPNLAAKGKFSTNLSQKKNDAQAILTSRNQLMHRPHLRLGLHGCGATGVLTTLKDRKRPL